MSSLQSAIGRRLTARILVPLRRRARRADPEHRIIFTGMFSVAAFLLAGRTMGAAKEMVVAYHFGVGIELDAYLLVLNWINVALSVWLAVIGTVLIPLWARARHGQVAGVPQFRAELLGFTLLLGGTLAAAGWLLMPRLLHAGWLGLSPPLLAAAEGMVPLLLPVAPLGLLAGLYATWILAAGRHVGTLLEGMQPLVISLGVLSLAAQGGGIKILAWSTLAGSAAYLVSVALASMRDSAIEAPRFVLRSPHWQTFWHGIGIVVIGQALMNSLTIVDQTFAVRLGAGAVATLGYSDRLTFLLLGLGGVAITRATLPVFARVRASGEGLSDRVVKPWVALMFGVGVVAAVVSWVVAPWVVKLLFERGAFMSQDTAAVTDVFRHGVAQLPFYFAGLVLVSKLLSLGLRRWVALSAIALFFIKITANTAFVPILGLNGIVVSTVVMYICSFAMLWVMAERADRVQVRADGA